jgi:hypothetical protein
MITIFNLRLPAGFIPRRWIEFNPVQYRFSKLFEENLADHSLLKPLQVEVKLLPIPMGVLQGGKEEFILTITRLMLQAGRLQGKEGSPPESRGDVRSRWNDVFVRILDIHVLSNIFLDLIAMVDNTHILSFDFRRGPFPADG